VSADTRRLLGGSFTLESLGPLELKGFAGGIEAWRVQGERRVATRFEAQSMQGLVEFIGRDSEIAMLLERWALAEEGEGQVVLLSGEAGIGKSRGMLTLDPLAARAVKLEQLAGALPAAPLGCLLRPMSLPDGGRSAPGTGSPQEEKAHTLEALIALLQRLSEQQPVLFLVEARTGSIRRPNSSSARSPSAYGCARVDACHLPARVRSPWSHGLEVTRHSLNRPSHWLPPTLMQSRHLASPSSADT
jgi:hypothetical protein